MSLQHWLYTHGFFLSNHFSFMCFQLKCYKPFTASCCKALRCLRYKRHYSILSLWCSLLYCLQSCLQFCIFASCLQQSPWISLKVSIWMPFGAEPSEFELFVNKAMQRLEMICIPKYNEVMNSSVEKILNKGMGHSPVLLLPQHFHMAVWVCILIPNGQFTFSCLREVSWGWTCQDQGAGSGEMGIKWGLWIAVPAEQCMSKE